MKPREMTKAADQEGRKVEEVVLTSADQARKRGGGDDKTEPNEGAIENKSEKKHTRKDPGRKEDDGERGKGRGKGGPGFPAQDGPGNPDPNPGPPKSLAFTRASL